VSCLTVRLVLASVNAAGLCYLRRAVSRRFGRLTGLFFTLFTCSQFHVPFWMGRTLPNMFALLPGQSLASTTSRTPTSRSIFTVNIALTLLVDRAPNASRPSKRSVEMAIALLAFTAVVFRAEVLLLLAPLVLQCLLLRYVTILNVIKIGIIAGLASIGPQIQTSS
jgi:alpha-1,6-mannosyltransferase